MGWDGAVVHYRVTLYIRPATENDRRPNLLTTVGWLQSLCVYVSMIKRKSLIAMTWNLARTRQCVEVCWFLVQRSGVRVRGRFRVRESAPICISGVCTFLLFFSDLFKINKYCYWLLSPIRQRLPKYRTTKMCWYCCCPSGLPITRIAQFINTNRPARWRCYTNNNNNNRLDYSNEMKQTQSPWEVCVSIATRLHHY